MIDRRSIPVLLAATAVILGGCTTNSKFATDSASVSEFACDESNNKIVLASIGPALFPLGAGDALGMELGKVYLVQHRMEREGVRMAAPDPARGFLD